MSKFGKYLAPILAALGIILLLAAIASPHTEGDAEGAARKLERRLERRLSVLNHYIDRPYAKLPEDMVIYVYTADSLTSWRGQFPLLNDRINSSLTVQKLVSPRANMDSPLSYVDQNPVLMNMGPNWYLVQARDDGQVRTISGLLLSSGIESSRGGNNPRLHLGMNYSIRPINASEGTVVNLRGRPVFKILYESTQTGTVANPLLMWLALVLLLAASVSFVYVRRTLKRALLSSAVIMAAISAMYIWGRGVQTSMSIFSPMVYAGGAFLYSLGAILLVNLAILFVTLSLYLARRDIWAKSHGATAIALSAAALLAVAGIGAYTHFSLRSLILNSNISLELYKLGTLSWYTLLVYTSVMSMLASVPMLLQSLQPAFSHVFGRHPDMFSGPARAVYSILVAAYIVTTAALLGFTKEQNRTDVWAARLAVDRDINLELQLLRVERALAEDAVIATLSGLEGSEAIIRGRIVDNYLLAASQDCSIGVQIYRPGGPAALAEKISDNSREGVPISPGSAFACMPSSDGPSRYCGLFRYAAGSSYSIMLLEVEQRAGLGKGYERLLSLSGGGSKTPIPSFYSYSRYTGGELRSFRGSYPYSTTMDDKLLRMVYTDGVRHYTRDGYEHFVSIITDDEAVIISRRSNTLFSYLMAGVLIALLMYVLLGALLPKDSLIYGNRPGYLRTRISLTLMASLILALVTMAAVSVIFVFRRNEANQRTIMAERINAIQLQAQNGMRQLPPDPDLVLSSEFAGLVQSVSDNTGTDISVYTPDGRIVLSTNPEILDHLILGYRIDSEALAQIITGHKRYCIIKKGSGLRHYYNIYMPLMGSDGQTVAILCSPYIENGYDFERDAVMHFMSMLTVFLLLFILARLTQSAMLDGVFHPLTKLGLSMERAELGAMDHIEYGRTDEISALVDAYNRMVDELSESSRALAMAERDKAWSAMARQVAHEIKNPLTPMKLQIQRLVRLKQKGDPSWHEKFDEVSGMLLDHIEILTQTSNEFSTFARLYTEEHTEIDLNKLLEEEISMFSGREDIQFSYMGLEGATINGPKPQLTRVFVNLLGNAVQAVEGREDAHVLVALRKGAREGFYDIVVEDNGPGVSEENIPKLFTPNFTTKNGGSGLGLAICRSILESCGATISYSRSFALGGACFTVSYPV